MANMWPDFGRPTFWAYCTLIDKQCFIIYMVHVRNHQPWQLSMQVKFGDNLWSFKPSSVQEATCTAPANIFFTSVAGSQLSPHKEVVGGGLSTQ